MCGERAVAKLPVLSFANSEVLTVVPSQNNRPTVTNRINREPQFYEELVAGSTEWFRNIPVQPRC